MSILKNLTLSVISGAIIGLWFGINMGNAQSLFSNPFSSSQTTEKVATLTPEQTTTPTQQANTTFATQENLTSSQP